MMKHRQPLAFLIIVITSMSRLQQDHVTGIRLAIAIFASKGRMYNIPKFRRKGHNYVAGPYLAAGWGEGKARQGKAVFREGGILGASRAEGRR